MDPATIALIASSVMSLFDGDDGQGAASQQQAELNKELLGMFRKREDLELPFRKNLLQALNRRSQKKFPRYNLPKAPPTFNPFQNMRTSMPTAPKGGQQASRPMSGFLSRMQRKPNNTSVFN